MTTIEVTGPPPRTLAAPVRAPVSTRFARKRRLVRLTSAPLLLLVGVLAENPVVLLLALVVAGAVALRRWMPWDVAVPGAFLGLLAAAVVLGVGGGATGLDLLARPWVVVGVMSVLVLVAVLTSSVHPPSARRPVFGGVRMLAFLPAGYALVTGLAQTLGPERARAWSFWGTDMAHHLSIVRDLQVAGHVDLASSGYPKGLQFLAALVAVPGAPLDDPVRLLDYDLQLFAALIWLSLALLLWTASAVAVRMGASLGLRSGVQAVAGLAVGIVLLLTNSFLETFLYSGGAQSLVAVVALWAIPLAVLADLPAARRTAVLVTGSALVAMLLCYLWQALALAPVLALAGVLAPRLPRILRSARTRRGRRTALRYLPALMVVTAVAVVPALQLGHGGLAAAAGTPGYIPGGSSPVLVMTLIVAATLLPGAARRHAWARLMLGSVLGLLAALALVVQAAGNGLDLEQYYPRKLLWFLLLFLAPVVAVTATELAGRVATSLSRLLGARVARPFVPRVALAALAGFVVVVTWLPGQLGAEALGATPLRTGPATVTKADGPDAVPNWSAQRFEIAVRTSTAFAPETTIVPYYVGNVAGADFIGTRIVSGILTFLTGHREIGGDIPDLCGTIDTAAGDGAAVVVSKLPAAAVRKSMALRGCAGRAEVVHLTPGLALVGAGS